jgi:hypothetical protein
VRAARRLLVATLLVAGPALGAGCAGGPAADPRLAAARAERDQQFQDNLARHAPRSADEGAALELLRRFQRAHETFDAAALAALLAPDFEHRLYPGSGVQIEGRGEFLAARAGWRARPQPARELAVAVQGAHRSERSGQLAVTALTTYRSKYFAPRYLESFVFARDGGGWKLRRIMSHPMRPPAPGLHGVQIQFAGVPGTQPPTAEAIHRDVLAEGPDVLFDRHWRLTGSSRTGVRDRTTAGPFLVIFREPPPPGAVIQLDERAYGAISQYDSAQITVGAAPGPYFYIVSRNRWWGSGFSVHVTVRLNGVPVAEETLSLS